MPILSVNNPSQVNGYLSVIVDIATFDPIPIDIVYDALGVWNFKWTLLPSARPTYPSIGIEDRVFLNILGSAIIFVVAFMFS